MIFRVAVVPRAQLDIEQIYDFIATVQQSPLGAQRWLDGVERAIRSLATSPRRGSAVREQAWLGSNHELRQILDHKHRILYSVEQDLVLVLHVRRGSRRDLESGDLEG